MAAHNDLGHMGEEAAARYLVLHGYHIRERNWRAGHRDLDIIAEKRGLLVFVEVKTRQSRVYGEPEEAVNAEKIHHLLRAANTYVQLNHLDMAIRFDVISVVGSNGHFDITHIREVFHPNDDK
ncbi:MAG: YraN family protein [Bacteroidaceae bacterium]|nr:YraN family protein [Bacteroidaceae bacterium]